MRRANSTNRMVRTTSIEKALPSSIRANSKSKGKAHARRIARVKDMTIIHTKAKEHMNRIRNLTESLAYIALRTRASIINTQKHSMIS